ncbi:hypothetical protein ACE1ET_20600, partial [Saccharicrinis sp. FJH62]|uniref:hypothetical protein n=1 Tax=Saccharicrinis sp. FJH62 TaxID=3344657 RepID=UPI0035D4D493
IPRERCSAFSKKIRMLNKIFNIETKEYRSKMNWDEFVLRFEKNIDYTSSEKGYNLTGGIKNGREFWLSKSSSIFTGDLSSLGYGPAFIKGLITSDEMGLKIKVKYRSNQILSLFTILLSLTGLIIIAQSLIFKGTFENLTFGIIFISIGFGNYILSRSIKENLKNKFEQIFELSNNKN